jgi:prepilin-type N-terminal cleavage/methylation domain-containing protein
VRVKTGTGFTLVEVLVAVMVLATGILALAGSAALTTRMVGRGGLSTRVALAAAGRIAELRRIALSTVPACTSPEWRGDSAGGPAFGERWDVLDASGLARRVRVVVGARHPAGISSDTVVAGILCGAP